MDEALWQKTDFIEGKTTVCDEKSAEVRARHRTDVPGGEYLRSLLLF
jgi:hypothetical protein